MKLWFALAILASGCGPAADAPPSASTAPPGAAATYDAELQAALVTAKQAERIIKAIEANGITAEINPTAKPSLEASNRSLEQQLATNDAQLAAVVVKVRELRRASPEAQREATIDAARWRQVAAQARAELGDLEAAMREFQEAQAEYNSQYAAATVKEQALADKETSGTAQAMRTGLERIAEARAAAMYAGRVERIYTD